MAKILVVGLNPAWQSILAFPDLRLGRVNRARAALSMASGKGINAAKVLKRLGHDVHVLQILGGMNGRRCLEGCRQLGLRSLVAWVESETRQCLTLRDTGNATVTELIEPFDVVDGEAIAEELLSRVDPSEGYAAAVVCGTVPQGIRASIAPDILRRARAPLAVVDAWQGFGGGDLSLATCFKINREELQALGERLGWKVSDPDPGRIVDWVASEAPPPLLVTSGPEVAWMLRQGQKPVTYGPPAIERVENPIGAGDTVTAGVTDGLLRGLELGEAFRRGLAMGSASCLLPSIAEFRNEDFQSLLPKVSVS